jgi:hypothetical protein
MKEIVFIINEDKRDVVRALFEQNNIPYREAGYPDGKVVVTESFNSKMNTYTDLLTFSQGLGYTSILGAIAGVGSSYTLKKMYKSHKEKLLRQNIE